MDDILIKNAYVITVDPKRRIIKDGALAIEGNEITDIGKTDELVRKHAADLEFDAAGQIALPGLIDSHVHSFNSICRGIEDGMTLLPYLNERLWPLNDAYNKDVTRLATLLSCLEMIKSGTTCFAEQAVTHHLGYESVVSAVEEAGIRASVGNLIDHETASVEETSPPDPDALIKETVGLIRKWHKAKDDRIRVWFGPGIPQYCDTETYQKVGIAAKENNTGINMHLAETKTEVSFIKRKYKKSAVEFVKDLGIAGPHVLFAHCVWLVDKDIQLLAKSKTNVCHNPSSNLKLASGIAKVPEMLENGVNVALGCDDATCNDCYDLIREMKMAEDLQRKTTESFGYGRRTGDRDGHN